MRPFAVIGCPVRASMNRRYLIALLAGLAALPIARGQAADLQSRVAAQLSIVEAWAADPVIVAAVRARNEARSAAATDMTQQRWTRLAQADPFVRELASNAAAAALNSKRTAIVSEAFISAADGSKVAFLAKPSTWNHKGKAKHDAPMRGMAWRGEVEIDESTGLEQIQVAVPVVDGGKPIGSLVVGLTVSKLIAAR